MSVNKNPTIFGRKIHAFVADFFQFLEFSCCLREGSEFFKYPTESLRDTQKSVDFIENPLIFFQGILLFYTYTVPRIFNP